MAYSNRIQSDVSETSEKELWGYYSQNPPFNKYTVNSTINGTSVERTFYLLNEALYYYNNL